VSAASATLATGAYGSRPRPALGRAAALSAIVHVALLGVLFLGVRFQSSAPATVTVELWEAPPAPPPPPVVQEKPPPPKPVPQPEPEVQIKKPEIALPEKPKPKPKPKPEPPKRDLAMEKQMREQAMAEEKQLQERMLREQLARDQARMAAAARDKALLTWTDKIRAKIKGNIVLPQDIPGDPEAIFDITILPTGDVLTVRKKKSSGHAGYDDAVERAIMKSSPLPPPGDRSVFRRDLELKFHPQEQR
jgi:colicin import membrane protein